jgi:hypothetical protein
VSAFSTAAQAFLSERSAGRVNVAGMEEERATRVVASLRERNVFAHVKLPHAGITQYGIRVVLPDGREAIWDNDGTAGLEAQIMRDGVLVGFVPSIPDSENFGDAQIIDAIAAADYNQPIGRSRPSTPTRSAGVKAPPRPVSLADRLRRTFRA